MPLSRLAVAHGLEKLRPKRANQCAEDDRAVRPWRQSPIQTARNGLTLSFWLRLSIFFQHGITGYQNRYDKASCFGERLEADN